MFKTRDALMLVLGLLPMSVAVTPSLASARSDATAVREIEVIVDQGYRPSRVVVTEGERVWLRFVRRDYSPCTREVVFPSLNLRRTLPTDEPASPRARRSRGRSGGASRSSTRAPCGKGRSGPCVASRASIIGHPGPHDDPTRAIECVFGVAARGIDAFAAERRRAGVLDFIDQEAFACALLAQEDRVVGNVTLRKQRRG